MANIAVGLTKDLTNGRVMRAIVNDQDLVVWRSASGHLSAWDNRCPHRGMRLSHGFVRGEALACMYHGWHYDGQAACRYIPAHPDLEPPETIKAKAFYVQDKSGLIWVSLEETSEFPSVDDDLLPVRSIKFDCKLAYIKTAIENFQIETCAGDWTGFDIKTQDDQTAIIGFDETNIWLHMFFQTLPDHKVALHALASDNTSNEQRKDMSRFLEDLRRSAEADCEAAA